MEAPSKPVFHADVVFIPDPEEQESPIDVEIYPDVPQLPKQDDDVYFDRPLFFGLYAMLMLATAGLVFSVTRYIQVTKYKKESSISSLPNQVANDPPPSVGSPSSARLSLIDVDPERDPVTYRSDIEYVLRKAKGDDSFTTFLEGAPKRAMDWLVYEDFVLTSSKVRDMRKSIEDASTRGGTIHPFFPLVQRYALIVLFFDTSGELWSDRSWTDLVDLDECKFMGVECDLEGQVTILDLGYRKLRGRLPDELGMLTKLVTLNLHDNSLEGTIPSFIYHKLTNLAYLDLSRNEISSTISSDISKLTNIRTLILNELSLKGRVQEDSMKSLSNLESIAITYSSRLSGPLLEWSDHWPNLTYFDVYHSGLSGSIPASISTNTKLQALWLEESSMNIATIPTEIGLLTNLREVVLDFEDSESGVGTIPTEIGLCHDIDHLHISGPSGSLPTEIGRLTNMISLLLVRGQLAGSIPSEIGRMTNLIELSFFDNDLNGSLPFALGDLKELSYAELNGNELTGSVPSGMCESLNARIRHDCGIQECPCCLPCI